MIMLMLDALCLRTSTSARTLNFSLLQLQVSSFVLLLIACVKNKIVVLTLASIASCAREPGFQTKAKEREKKRKLFGNLSQTEILSKEGSFRKLLTGMGLGYTGGGLEDECKCTEQDYVNMTYEPAEN